MGGVGNKKSTPPGFPGFWGNASFPRAAARGLGRQRETARVPVAGARGLGRHDESSPALRPQVAVEVGDPEVVAVRDLLGFVHAGQAEREAANVFYLLGVHHVDVEGRSEERR